MNGKIRIALLLTVAFMLCNSLAAVAAGGFHPNILLSEDKLRYQKGGPKAATISLPKRAAAQSLAQPKAKTTTVAQAAQQAPVVQAARQAAPPPEKPKAAPAPAVRAAPSFNCAKASNAVEHAICADPSLAAIDVSMAADYKKALKAVPNRAALRAEQRRWLRQMHSQCSNGAFQCIQQHYGTRSAQLRAY
jgi:uncharacterized protein YecT (DUF1311 family)